MTDHKFLTIFSSNFFIYLFISLPVCVFSSIFPLFAPFYFPCILPLYHSLILASLFTFPIPHLPIYSPFFLFSFYSFYSSTLIIFGFVISLADTFLPTYPLLFFLNSWILPFLNLTAGIISSPGRKEK